MLYHFHKKISISVMVLACAFLFCGCKRHSLEEAEPKSLEEVTHSKHEARIKTPIGKLTYSCQIICQGEPVTNRPIKIRLSITDYPVSKENVTVRVAFRNNAKAKMEYLPIQVKYLPSSDASRIFTTSITPKVPGEYNIILSIKGKGVPGQPIESTDVVYVKKA